MTRLSGVFLAAVMALMVGATGVRAQAQLLDIPSTEVLQHLGRTTIPMVRAVGQDLAIRTLLQIEASVDEEGRVTAVRFERPGRRSDIAINDATAAAIEAEVRAWRFSPFAREGLPSAARVRVPVAVYPGFRTPSRHVAFPNGDLSTVRVHMLRTACFGSCPIYSVEIKGDGEVTYTGLARVSTVGAVKGRIPLADVQRLVEAFRQKDFYSMDSSYSASVTDMPSTCLTFSIGGVEKTVEDHVGVWVGMPEAITQLQGAVDQAVKIEQWTTNGPPQSSGSRSGPLPVTCHDPPPPRPYVP